MPANEIINKVATRYYSDKLISLACLTIAIIAKIIIVHYFFSVDDDKMLQALAAKNFSDGHGISILQVHATNLSNIVYEPLIGWPPGYSLLLAPFYLLSKNIYTACLLLDIISAAMFLLLLSRLLKLMAFPAYLINLLILLNGFNIPEYTQSSTATDLLAMIFCLWGCYLLIRFMEKGPQKNESALTIGLIGSLAGLFRYVYIPISFIFPAFLIWNGVQQRNRHLIKRGLYSSIATGLIIIPLVFFQKYYTGNGTYTIAAQKGIFWDNLLYLHPVVITSFINLNFYALQLYKLTGIAYSSWKQIAAIAGFLLLVPFVFRFIKCFIQTKFIADKPRTIFFIIGGIISFFSLLILCYLSVTNSRYLANMLNQQWTYVGEGRYYAFAWIFFQIYCVWFLFGDKKNSHNNFFKALKIFIAFIVVIEISHGVYFIGKYILKGRSNNVEIAIKKEADRKIDDIINDGKKRNIVVVISSTNSNFCSHAVLSGGNALYNSKELNNDNVVAIRPTSLIAILKEDQLGLFKVFLNRKGVSKLCEIGDYLFFIQSIQPSAAR